MSMVWLLVWFMQFFFFKQKTAYEMRISDWSSDVCSSDLLAARARPIEAGRGALSRAADAVVAPAKMTVVRVRVAQLCSFSQAAMQCRASVIFCSSVVIRVGATTKRGSRSEEHTSELQSLMRISYAVFCLKKKKSSTHS